MNGFTFEEIKFLESICANVTISSETMDCYGGYCHEGYLYGNESQPIFSVPYATNISIDVDLANVGSGLDVQKMAEELHKLFDIVRNHPTCHWNIYTTPSTEACNRYSNNMDKEIDKEIDKTINKEIDTKIFDILNGE